MKVRISKVRQRKARIIKARIIMVGNMKGLILWLRRKYKMELRDSCIDIITHT